MKRWMKGVAIAGVVLFFIGTAITALAAAVGNARGENYSLLHWKGNHIHNKVINELEDNFWNSYESEQMETFETEKDSIENAFIIPPKKDMKLVGTYDSIRKLEIKAQRAAVKIVENSELTDEIRVYLKEDSYARVTTENDDGPTELSVKYSWTLRRGVGYAQGIVEIPVGYQFHEAELKAEAGKMEADAIYADDLEVSAQAGEVVVANFHAIRAELSAEAGSVQAAGDVDSYLETEAKAGAVTVTLAGDENDYNMYFDNALGSVKIGESVYSGSSSKRKTGSGGSKTVEIDCEAGSVELQFKAR